MFKGVGFFKLLVVVFALDSLGKLSEMFSFKVMTVPEDSPGPFSSSKLMNVIGILTFASFDVLLSSGMCDCMVNNMLENFILTKLRPTYTRLSSFYF